MDWLQGKCCTQNLLDLSQVKTTLEQPSTMLQIKSKHRPFGIIYALNKQIKFRVSDHSNSRHVWCRPKDSFSGATSQQLWGLVVEILRFVVSCFTASGTGQFTVN